MRKTTAWVAVLTLAAGAAGARTLNGASQDVRGAKVATWATMDGEKVKEVGVTIPMSVIKRPPASPGHGPAGAVAVLAFPPEIQKATYMNHLEMHWNPQGHIPPIFQVPHFDFHFYSTPESDVRAIMAMDETPPAPEFLPKGYIYPGKDTFEMQMGVHTLDPAVMEKPFTAVMIGGCSGGRMTFVEPMVTQAYLLSKKDLRLEMPVPAKFGRATLYPMKFQGKYDAKSDAYRFVFSDFRPVE